MRRKCLAAKVDFPHAAGPHKTTIDGRSTRMTRSSASDMVNPERTFLPNNNSDRNKTDVASVEHQQLTTSPSIVNDPSSKTQLKPSKLHNGPKKPEKFSNKETFLCTWIHLKSLRSIFDQNVKCDEIFKDWPVEPEARQTWVGMRTRNTIPPLKSTTIGGRGNHWVAFSRLDATASIA